MGALGLDTFKAMVKMRLGQATSWSSVSDTDYYTIWVNQAYNQICAQDHLFGLKRRARIPELETSTTDTTADGTAYIDVPSDCLVIRSVYDETNKVKLDFVPWLQYIEYTDRSTATAEGDPKEWVRSGAYIYLHPTPDATMTMRIYYKKLPADLSGTQTTAIGKEWDVPIVLLATYYGMSYTGEYENAKFVRNELIETLNGLVTIYDSEEKDRDERARPDPSEWRK